ncbi:hypothetical protein SLE2022_007720 [Rubroshorea leprosula]|uniref:Uncharacterized protein n=1 Tax=Rubroshorea leprosula TaxID=152421 RepID=A0AAV5KAT1_9ROSI|nr:hypothetical protein SLEP1_g31712 [Rubroshorea leprosula]
MVHEREIVIISLDMDDKKSDAKRKGMKERSLTGFESSDINKDADAFIRNFRIQLEIQSGESIKCYQKMKARGA